MQYTLEVHDGAGRLAGRFEDVPLVEAVRRGPDAPDRVRGLLPRSAAAIGAGYRVRVLIDGALFCEGRVHWTGPAWSDLRKLILDRYVPFPELIAFDASSDPERLNGRVSRAYANREIGAVVRDLANRAPGPLHYWVNHTAYPEGAEREHAKFLARRTAENALGYGGVSEGQWVGADRIDASGAYAKDGDTIAGLKVDGAAWPDLRLMMIDCEELTRNAHAVARHAEVGGWSDARYAASGYRARAEAAKAFLQGLLGGKGIDWIELNPHRNALGSFDDRIDAYGRYIGLVYGGGECFNAAMVEEGHADVYLYEDGRYHVPEMALKEFYSYAGAHRDSVMPAGRAMLELDVRAGALEAVAALAYAAGGYVFDVDVESGLHFYPPERVSRVLFYDPVRMGFEFGEESAGLANLISASGNPYSGGLSKTYARAESMDAYGAAPAHFAYHAVRTEGDADALLEGLLDDVAYAAPRGAVTFYRGDAALRVGELVELRDGPLRRLAPLPPGAWGGRFAGRLAARVVELRHRLMGRRVETRALLGAPLRSVPAPLAYLVRSQGPADELFAFRLDDGAVGLDRAYHLA